MRDFQDLPRGLYAMILDGKNEVCKAIAKIGPARLEYEPKMLKKSAGAPADHKTLTCWKLDGQQATVGDLLLAAGMGKSRPRPPRGRGAKTILGPHRSWPWQHMKVGDTTVISALDRKAAGNAARSYAHLKRSQGINMRIRCKKLQDGNFLFWRAA